MECRTVRKKLSVYQDRELDQQEQEQVRSHLRNCQACREQHGELEGLWQILGKIEEIQPDPGFYRQLIRKINEPRKQGLLPSLQHLLLLLRAPAIVSLLLAAGLMAGSYLGSVLTQYKLPLLDNNPPGYSEGTVFHSLKVFDPAPPGTFAEGYLRMVSYKENDSR